MAGVIGAIVDPSGPSFLKMNLVVPQGHRYNLGTRKLLNDRGSSCTSNVKLDVSVLAGVLTGVLAGVLAGA